MSYTFGRTAVSDRLDSYGSGTITLFDPEFRLNQSAVLRLVMGGVNIYNFIRHKDRKYKKKKIKTVQNKN